MKASWSRSTSQKGIPHAKPFRVEGSFERKTVGPKYCKMQPKLTFWSIWVVLGLKWFKMVPKLIPSEGFRPSKPLQTTPSECMGSSKHLSTTLPKVWAFQVSSNSPFPRVWGRPSIFQHPLPRVLGFPSVKRPLRSPSETCFKQPFRTN